jgi:hypothetical protein
VTASLGANWVPTSPFHPWRGYAKSLQPFNGEVPERSNGAVSKTVVPLAGTEGSNPSLSAI